MNSDLISYHLKNIFFRDFLIQFLPCFASRHKNLTEIYSRPKVNILIFLNRYTIRKKFNFEFTVYIVKNIKHNKKEHNI